MGLKLISNGAGMAFGKTVPAQEAGGARYDNVTIVWFLPPPPYPPSGKSLTLTSSSWQAQARREAHGLHCGDSR